MNAPPPHTYGREKSGLAIVKRNKSKTKASNFWRNFFCPSHTFFIALQQFDCNNWTFIQHRDSDGGNIWQSDDVTMKPFFCCCLMRRREKNWKKGARKLIWKWLSSSLDDGKSHNWQEWHFSFFLSSFLSPHGRVGDACKWSLIYSLIPSQHQTRTHRNFNHIRTSFPLSLSRSLSRQMT